MAAALNEGDPLVAAAPEKKFDRFDSWDKFMAANFSQTRRYRSQSGDFWARSASTRFDALHLFNLESSAYVAEVNNERLSLPGHDPHYTVIICLSGGYKATHDGLSGTLAPGDMLLFDSRQARAIGGTGDSALMLLMMPRSVWEAHAPAPVMGHQFVLQGQSPTARLARNFAVDVARANANIGEQYRPLVSRQVVELLSVALEDGGDALPETLHRQVLMRKIKSFVRANLANPAMKPSSVADHFGVSVRYVSQLFSDEEETLMTYMKRARIRRAAEMLRAAGQSKMPIKDVYHRVGFKTHAHFTSTFSAQLGVSPQAYVRRGS